MKKKVLFVIDSLVCGGAEKSLVSLLPLLNREKYELHLWILHRGKVFESLLQPDVILENAARYSFIEQFRFKLAHVCYSFVYRILLLTRKHEHTAETLWKCAGSTMKAPIGKYDVAIAYQQGVPTYLVATKIKALKKIAWINADIFAAGYNPDFNAKYYKKYNVIVPVSHKLESILKNNYRQYSFQYQCVYDIINGALIKLQTKEPIKEEVFFRKDIIIVTTGRMAAAKNYSLAVESAKVLQERGVDFDWFFIGDGEETPMIESQILRFGLHNNVHMLGERTNPYPYMANCTIYVQTSTFEGFGLTIAEAKILGKPIVSTNFSVVHDQLINEQTGLIADMTAESVADNIMRLLEDKQLRARIVANLSNEKNETYITEVKKVESLLDAN